MLMGKLSVKNMYFLCQCLCIYIAWAGQAYAQVFAVDQLQSGFFISAQPTQTLYWQGQKSKAVIVFIPGGEGYIGLKPTQTDHGYQFYRSLKQLTDPSLTSGRYDVVLMDSPAPLSPRQAYPAARTASDHMVRILSTVQFYAKKTGLPVWLMGHSNGGISMSEFLKYAQKNNHTQLIAGMIPSGIRSESYFEAPINMPILFLHHEKDGCHHTLGAKAHDNYIKVKALNTAATEFVWIKGGETEATNECVSGHHMYFKAGSEMSSAIDAFLSTVYKTP